MTQVQRDRFMEDVQMIGTRWYETPSEELNCTHNNCATCPWAIPKVGHGCKYAEILTITRDGRPEITILQLCNEAKLLYESMIMEIEYI